MTPTDPLTLELTSVRRPEAMELIARLGKDLELRYNEPDNGHFKPEDVEVPGSGFVVARWNGEAIGCGAFRPLKDDIAEVKRMYVEPAYRNRGIGRRILTELEEHARRAGYRRIWLETGTAQPEALRIYESAGYRVIHKYGYYRDDPRSVCFAKTLV